MNGGKKVDENIMYTLDNNSNWMTVEDLHAWIEENRDKICCYIDLNAGPEIKE